MTDRIQDTATTDEKSSHILPPPMQLSSRPGPSSIAPSESNLVRELTLVSLVVLPLLALPFLPLRKRLNRISAHVSDMKSVTQTALRQASIAQDRDLTLLEGLRADLARHKESTDVQLRDIKVAQALIGERQAKSERFHGDLKKLKADVQTLSTLLTTVKQDGNKYVSSLSTARPNLMMVLFRLSPQVIEEIASSFVDVAGFIEEVETMVRPPLGIMAPWLTLTQEGLERRGIDPRGVDKMRRLAMNLHATANGTPRP